jgi:polyhydroxyalkanoate synthase
MKDNVTPAPAKIGALDVELFSRNVARMVEDGGKALAAYMRARDHGQIQHGLSDEMTDMVKTLGEVAEYWLADPQRALELQSRLGKA